MRTSEEKFVFGVQAHGLILWGRGLINGANFTSTSEGTVFGRVDFVQF